jgi:hypothetical protein
MQPEGGVEGAEEGPIAPDTAAEELSPQTGEPDSNAEEEGKEATTAAAPVEYSDATLWKWLGASSNPKHVERIVQQQAQLANEHSAALGDSITCIARTAKNIDGVANQALSLASEHSAAISQQGEHIASLQTTVSAESEARQKLGHDLGGLEGQMKPFKRDAEERISQLRVTGEQSQSKLRQLDLKLTKMDMLPDKVEILESQFGRLNKGITNIESGMSADNPLAGEFEGLSARVRELEEHSLRQSQQIDMLLRHAAADACTDAVLSTMTADKLNSQIEACPDSLHPDEHFDAVMEQHYAEALRKAHGVAAGSLSSRKIEHHLEGHLFPHLELDLDLHNCFTHWAATMRKKTEGVEEEQGARAAAPPVKDQGPAGPPADAPAPAAQEAAVHTSRQPVDVEARRLAQVRQAAVWLTRDRPPRRRRRRPPLAAVQLPLRASPGRVPAYAVYSAGRLTPSDIIVCCSLRVRACVRVHRSTWMRSQRRWRTSWRQRWSCGWRCPRSSS